MADLHALETNLAQQMQTALATKDFAHLGKLNAVALRLEHVKREIDGIESALTLGPQTSTNSARPRSAPPINPGSPLTGCDIEISQGDINQRLLRTAVLAKLNLVPPEGTDFEVKALTPRGEFSFTTSIDPITHTRLKARGEISQFYREAGINAGDLVRWEKVDAVTYRIYKA